VFGHNATHEGACQSISYCQRDPCLVGFISHGYPSFLKASFESELGPLDFYMVLERVSYNNGHFPPDAEHVFG